MDHENHDRGVIADLAADLAFAKRILQAIQKESKKNKVNPDRIHQLATEALDRID